MERTMITTISGLAVSRLCLGGNVFGWTVDAAEAFAVLDAFTEGGGNFIDTADQYVDWVPGGRGGESEEIIGAWMAARGNRDAIVVGTKVGKGPDARGLSSAAIRTSVEASLRRLRTDCIDVYYAHEDDPSVPLTETLETFDALVREGKIRRAAASNYTAVRLEEALTESRENGWAAFSVLQPHYNLVRRGIYEGELERVCERAGIACVPYFSLASGFLTGKYRPGVEIDSPRARAAAKYLDDRGLRILSALDDIASREGTSVAAVSLAWLVAQPTVMSAVASGTSAGQVAELLAVGEVELGDDELQRLGEASAGGPAPRQR